ncbi:pilus assembly protein TadG-related protein [Paremcibacter congregatus]|uniref:pilus assembly protein TadG-related protein n=1 Tax=Paremcibacter congregatus TaxID=2043170 RepID=UPI0030EEA46F|tara:strand:- start:16747 stop:18057 length:1311 start_codon:yes stop_codon:yes gene_type:complete
MANIVQKYLSQQLSRLKKSTSGAALVYFAILVPLIAGFAGLGFDATMWFMQKRQMQTAADSSALAAAYALSKDQTDQEIILAATKDAEANNFTTGNGNSLSLTTPPVTGGYAGQSNYVMVKLNHPAELVFTKMLDIKDIEIRTTATAGILKVGEHCILALDETMDKALEFSGTSDVDINCGVASNSNSTESIYLNGTATLSANPSAQAYGDIYQGTNATLNTPNPIQPLSQRAIDPYGPEGRDLEVPTLPSICINTGNLQIKLGDPDPLPGRYCGDMTFNANADTTLVPGVYIIDGGDLTIRGGATLSGTGVTFVLTAADPDDIGTVDIGGGATIDLTAPNHGDYAGIVFFQDPRALYTEGDNKFLGGPTMNIKGAVYFPGQELRFSGGSSTSSGCLQLLGRKVTFTGNSKLYNDQSDCAFLGIEKISRTLVTMVE